ncbi:MAG: N(4)-(beta-N-acetylglucosaminyl)-L-asparaginase [Candidatus Methanomethylicia archaeon]|nr:N(4)-(beta-N-acetylglucosaminyl)-L-asparaginase [Candidatus Methanomethylicia archaeon]
MVLARIIGTRNAGLFLSIGVEILKRGGSAIDAVEATINAVEDNPLDYTVGYGGIPNLLGEVELDASIMDGKTLKAGAVAGIKHFKNPISIAKKVMELTPHVLLIGEGAELFAEAIGFKRCELLTERSKKIYEAFLKDKIDELNGIFEDEEYKKRLYQYVRDFNLREWYEKLAIKHEGTVNVIAMDFDGNICVGVSTSGTPLKLPGRVGDSAIIGAGNYADNNYGGAACTGRGELTIRCSTAKSIIYYLKEGLDVKEACIKAIRDINKLNEMGGVNCIAMDKNGNTWAASNRRIPIYYYMDVNMDKPERKEGSLVTN